MKTFKRAKRVAPLVLEILAELIQHRVRDPRVKGAVLTRVDMGDDLKVAKVYFHSLDTDRQQVSDGLDKARGYLRRELGLRLEMKYTPELRFYPDGNLEHTERIERILRDLKLNDQADE